MKKIYQYFHLLQFDIAFGAVGISIWFARLENIQYDYLIPTLLGLTVWLIYTFDHLLDAYRYRHQIKGGRYEYFLKHWKVLIIICSLIAIPSFFVALQLSKQLWQVGITLSMVVSVYLFLAHFARSKFYLLKELFVDIIYTGGVLIANIAEKGFRHNSLAIFWVFAVVFCVLLIYSILEREDDARMKMPSITKQLGLKQITNIHDLFLSAAFMSWLLLSYAYSFDWLWLLPSSIMMIMFLQFRIKAPYFYRMGTHRNYGELIFVIPCIVLIIEYLLFVNY